LRISTSPYACGRAATRRRRGFGEALQEFAVGRASDRRRRAACIKRYLATRDDKLPWLFISKRRQPLTHHAVNYLIGAIAREAGSPGVHPHTLRHYLPFLTMSSDGPGSGDLSEINRSPRVEAWAITRHSFLDATNG